MAACGPRDVLSARDAHGFVDRPSDVAELEQCLLARGRSRRVFVLYGFAGIGKTQLAANFARRHRTVFSSVIWLNAATEATLQESLARHAPAFHSEPIIGEAASLGQAVGLMLQWLASPDNSGWLVVFDGVGQGRGGDSMTKAEYVKRYIPDGDGSVLITSRLSHLAALGDSKLLRSVDEGLAKEIFEQRCGNWHVAHPSYDPSKILPCFGGIPLAIAQAASYLRETGCDAISYLRMFEKEWCKLIASDEASCHWLLDYPHGSMTTVWAGIFESIQAENDDAARLLLFWSCIDHNDLWFDLLRSTNLRQPRWQWFQELAESEVQFLSVMRLLLRYSIIEKRPCGYYMHPLVHRWVSHLPTASEMADYRQLAISVIGQATPPNVSRDFWPRQKRILPHAERCVAWLKQGVPPEEQYGTTALRSVHLLGDLFLDQGLLKQAEFIYCYVMERCTALLGPDHLSTLGSMKSLGNTYSRQARFPEAMKLYCRTLEVCEATFGPGHSLTLEAANDLAGVYLNQGSTKEAEWLYGWALEGKKKVLGLDDPSTLNTLSSLANVYAAQTEWGEAEERYCQALHLQVETLGPEHPFTLNTLSNLGLLYAQIRRVKDAEAICRRALAGYELACGPAHHLTLNIVHNIGTLLIDQNKCDAAATMYQRALEGYLDVFGPDHPTVLDTMSNLASAFEQIGRLGEAEDLYWKVLGKHMEKLGSDDPSTLSTFSRLTTVLKNQGLHEVAENMQNRAATGLELAQLLASSKFKCCLELNTGASQEAKTSLQRR